MSTTECEYFFFGNLLGSFFDKFITSFLSNLKRGLSNRGIDFNFLYDRRKLFMDSFKLSFLNKRNLYRFYACRKIRSSCLFSLQVCALCLNNSLNFSD